MKSILVINQNKSFALANALRKAIKKGYSVEYSKSWNVDLNKIPNYSIVVFGSIPRNKNLILNILKLRDFKNVLHISEDGSNYITNVVSVDFTKRQEHFDKRSCLDIYLNTVGLEDNPDYQEQEISGLQIQEEPIHARKTTWEDITQEDIKQKHYSLYIKLYELDYPSSREDWEIIYQQIDYYLANKIEVTLPQEDVERIINNYESKAELSPRDKSKLRYSELDYLI